MKNLPVFCAHDRLCPPVLAVLLALASLCSALPRAAAGEVRALATDVRGQVTVLESLSRQDAPPEPSSLHPLDLLPDGSILQLEAGERITLLCSTEHVVVVQGPARWRLSDEECRGGNRQPAGTFSSLVPRRGRLIEVGDVLALEMTTRREETGGNPVLLAPRNTALLEPPTHLVWRSIPGALEYEVRIVGGGGGGRTATVEPPEADCGASRPEWPDEAVCTLPWSRLGTAQIPTDGLYLRVGGRFSLGAPMRRERRSPKVWGLPAEKRREVEERLRSLRAEEDAPWLRAVLEARLLLDHELYEVARRRLLDALALAEAPVLRVTLGDLYFRITLPERAVEHYRRASKSAADPAVRAAAFYGLGRVRYHQDRYAAAQKDFERAGRFFGRAGLESERQAAAEAAARAQHRQPHGTTH